MEVKVNKCSECKYLGDEILAFDDETFEDKPTGFHQCQRVKFFHGLEDELAGLPDLAIVVDGSGYFGALRVKGDFGCVNFKGKDDERI